MLVQHQKHLLQQLFFELDKHKKQEEEKLRQRKRLEISSGAVTSGGISSPVKIEERGFWLQANTELIVYGASEPDAKVTIQGQIIQLRPDGSFSLRFALPDGEQSIPISAQSCDGAKKISR